MNQKHLFITVLLMVSVIVSGCGPSAEQAGTMTAAAWTLTPTVTATPTEVPISADLRLMAEQAFEQGVLVYLYDPQPNTVSVSNLSATEFSIRYILSKNAEAEMLQDNKADFPAIIYIRETDAEGGEDNVIAGGNNMDWKRETGQITFTGSTITIWTSYVSNNPNMGDPVSLAVVLFSPVLDNSGAFTIDATSRQLSNVVKIPVGP